MWEQGVPVTATQPCAQFGKTKLFSWGDLQVTPPTGRKGQRFESETLCTVRPRWLEGGGVYLKGGIIYKVLTMEPRSQYLNGWDMALGCPLTSSNLQKPETDA